MKILFFLFLFVSVNCFSQSDSTFQSDRINSLVEKISKGIITKADRDELRNYGYSIQNKGFTLDEKRHDYPNAFKHINNAIQFWISIKDASNEANLRKYKGLLLGRLNRFDEGKQEIRKAIGLFKELNKDQGVAVSQYDMSLVLDLEGSLDSALFYQKSATIFWINKKDSSRIVVNRTHLIHLYRRLKEYDKALDVQKLNEQALKGNEHWNPLINFYFVSYKLFEEIGDESKADYWKMLYFDKLTILKKQGITVKSIYD